MMAQSCIPCICTDVGMNRAIIARTAIAHSTIEMGFKDSRSVDRCLNFSSSEHEEKIKIDFYMAGWNY